MPAQPTAGGRAGMDGSARGAAAGERGATAVEFALVIPVLLGLVALVIIGSLGLTYAAVLHRGAEVAARAVAVPVRPYADVTTRHRTAAEVTEAVNSATPLLDPDVIIVRRPDGTEIDPDLLPTALGENQPFTVELRWRWRFPAAGFIAAVGGSTGDGTLTLEAHAEGVRE